MLQKKQYNDRFSRTRPIMNGSRYAAYPARHCNYPRHFRWYELQAWRAINQAIGRCIRHRHDYGAIVMLGLDLFSTIPIDLISLPILAEDRLQGNDAASMLPRWIREGLQHFEDFGHGIQSLKAFFTEKPYLAGDTGATQPPAPPSQADHFHIHRLFPNRPIRHVNHQLKVPLLSHFLHKELLSPFFSTPIPDSPIRSTHKRSSPSPQSTSPSKRPSPSPPSSSGSSPSQLPPPSSVPASSLLPAPSPFPVLYCDHCSSPIAQTNGLLGKQTSTISKQYYRYDLSCPLLYPADIIIGARMLVQTCVHNAIDAMSTDDPPTDLRVNNRLPSAVQAYVKNITVGRLTF